MWHGTKAPLPSGLPNQFADRKQGFARLRQFLEIPNSKYIEALLDTEGVKDAVQHVSVAGLRGADRRRVLLTAFYGMPDSRRELWRNALDRLPDANTSKPSLEFLALQGYDEEFCDREVDTDAIEDALRDLPDVAESVVDAPEWQRPALAVWPKLRQDIDEWSTLPDDRQKAVELALFAVATVLDNVCFLQWARSRVEVLGDQFTLFLPDEPRLTDDDVIRKWKETCESIAATAMDLGADPPQPNLLPNLDGHVRVLAELRDPLVRFQERTALEPLLQRVHDVLAQLLQKYDPSPLTRLTEQITAHWRLAYTPNTNHDAKALSADVERLRRDLEEALADWDSRRQSKAALEETLTETQRRAESASDPVERLRYENECVGFQGELHHAAEAVKDARDRVFHAAGAAGGQFDPYLGRENELTGPDNGGRDQPDPPDDSTSKATATEPSEPTEPDNGGRDQPDPPDDSTSKATATEPSEPTEPDNGGRDQPDPPDDSTSKATATEPSEPTEPDRGTDQPDQPDNSTPLATPIAIWTALGNARFGVAYHLARLLPADGRTDASLPLVNLIAASALAPYVRSPDDPFAQALRPFLETLDPAAVLQDCPQRAQDQDAVNLLLFSAALRPTLLAPSTAAASLLRAVHMSGGLEPVYTLATEVARHADLLQGIRLHAPLFRPRLNGSTWDEAFRFFVTRTRDWRVRADSKRNLFGRANKVWRNLLVPGGRLAELIELLSEANETSRSRVEAIRKQIADQKAFNDLVRRTDRGKRTRGDAIQGRALKQIWNDVQPAVTLSAEWLSLMDTKPGARGFVTQRIASLRSDIQPLAGNALIALEEAASHADTAPLVATLKVATDAVDDLRQLFGHTTGATDSNLTPEIIQSRDLLYVTNLDLDTEFKPVPTDPSQWRDLLMDTEAHADTMRGAFDARLERNDFVGAHLALDSLDAEGDPDVDDCREALLAGIDKRRGQLRTALQKAQEGLERAFCRGQLRADDRDDMHAELTGLRQVVEPSSGTPLHLAEVAVLAGSSRLLPRIDERIAASRKRSIEDVRNRLRNVPVDRMDVTAKSLVDQTIDEGDVQTADEQISRLENGETVTPRLVVEDPFLEFTQVVERIEAARKTTDVATIMKAVQKRESAAGVPFDSLSEDAAQTAADLLKAWYDLARKRSFDKTLLGDILRHLGFGVRTITALRPGSQATVTTEPIADRRLCPSRQFGSDADGRYRVLLSWDRAATDSIFRSLGPDGGAPAVVLHFACLGSSRDELRQRATREHRLFLVVDESLVLFLAGRESGWLSTLFRCTLPYSAAQPYATTSGLVPPELFYGRDLERSAIMDPSGACFLYGGRQLGKTALLRRVEHDFNRAEDTHIAKWIDLKVNEIDRAPDIWRVLQRELRRSRVVRRDREIDPESENQVKSLLDEIRRWLDDRASRRLLLLLDEADHFLDVDERNNFRESDRLKGLMDSTNRRFKVVFAGLHNVLRTTRQANHPLAHLGDPIRIGAMLSNGEWKQAQALVREPLQAVGCRFARDDLSTRILAYTNYYPSLIQLYGAELVSRLREFEKTFPYEIEDHDIDDAYTGRELRDAIRERFLLTLQLDQRYEVIAYALAYELKEGTDLHRGLERGRIFEEAKYWWEDGFRQGDNEFNMLLQEMEGLGVLRAIEPDRYTLRNPNILLLLGGAAEVEGALNRERELLPGYLPWSFRARYPQEPSSSPRRGPLTRQQESSLRDGGVAVICGCAAAGLEDVPEFLSKRVGSDEFSRIQSAANAAQFEQQLLKLRSARNAVTVRLVPPDVNWDVAWVRTAKRVLQKKAQGKRLWNRVAFIATPEVLWRLLTDATESDLDGVDWCELGPCDRTFLRRWLEDTDAAADADKAEEFRRISGGWLAMLDRFGRKTNRPWQTRIAELERELARYPAKRLRDKFGLTADLARVFRVLVGADDPFDLESIELVSSEVGENREDILRRVHWAERLGLLSRVGNGSWTFNTLVRDLLEQSGPA